VSDIILFNKDFEEIGVVSLDIDAECGTEGSNDFEIKTDSIQEYEPYGLYLEGSEIGGVLEYERSQTGTTIQTLKGWMWRGLLTQNIIEPPSGSDYKVVSGDANEIIADMLSDVLGGFFLVPEDETVTITDYQFPLYCTMLEGLEGMLEAYDYRLSIHADKIGSKVVVTCEAVPSITVSGVFNEDNGIPMIFESDNMGVNHLLCAGSGQLQQRTKINLYCDVNGNISTTQSIFGFNERMAFFDDSGSESADDLMKNGIKRLKEIRNSRTLKMNAPELDLEVGDKVKGTFPDGTVVVQPVITKIYKIEHGLLNTEIKIKGGQ
jgi:hypothetical protein